MITEGLLISIAGAKQIGAYKLELEFNDKTKQTVDFYPFLSSSHNPFIRRYLAPEEFAKFAVLEGDLEWNDYDLCFPVADLYEDKITP
ncbi:MAG: DUF2442 domain-containing protein [Gammaproteobacteria bacterium]|nr:DUF2442 domain-containing protein [Gammaproteobacteria bacterium]